MGYSCMQDKTALVKAKESKKAKIHIKKKQIKRMHLKDFELRQQYQVGWTKRLKGSFKRFESVEETSGIPCTYQRMYA